MASMKIPSLRHHLMGRQQFFREFWLFAQQSNQRVATARMGLFQGTIAGIGLSTCAGEIGFGKTVQQGSRSSMWLATT